MPYVPSEKSNPPAEDRKILDVALERIAGDIAGKLGGNLSLIGEYKRLFLGIAFTLKTLFSGRARDTSLLHVPLAEVIWDVGARHGYEGAYLGELNYTITRLIQRVPQIMVESGKWKDEFRYWLYAATVEALVWASYETCDDNTGVSGVFEDIKDEYKWRVNRSYEGVQIVKSGDCYDSPYYSRLASIVDENGRHIGYIDVQLDRSKVPPSQRKDPDILSGSITLKREGAKKF